MAKKRNGSNQVRLYPKARKALEELLHKVEYPVSRTKLANHAIVKGVEVLSK